MQVKPGLVTPFGPAPTFDELQKFKSRGGGSSGGGRRGGADDADADGEGGGDGASSSSGKAALKSAEDALLEQISATVSRGASAAAGAGGEDGGAALRPGDAVVVVRGELQNVTGRVVAVNPGGTFTLQPSAESSAQLGLTDRMELLVRRGRGDEARV